MLSSPYIIPEYDEADPAKASHFLVQGILLSAWRFFGNKPATMHIQWPLISHSHSTIPTAAPLPLLQAPHLTPEPGKAQWFPIQLQRAWCVGSWQCLFFSPSWRPYSLGIFVCKQYHPMLRMYLRHLECEARLGGASLAGGYEKHHGMPWGAHVF
jgi:hypothetical protein